MNFLNRDETEKRKASLRRRLSDNPRPVFYYESNPEHDYLSAARALVVSFGTFQRATLLYFFSVQGDGWNEILLADARSARFRSWREAHGEMRRLHDAPGQQFAANDGDALVEAIASRFAWDGMHGSTATADESSSSFRTTSASKVIVAANG